MNYYGISKFKAQKKTIKEVLEDWASVKYNSYFLPYTYFVEEEGNKPISIHKGFDWIQDQNKNKKIFVLTLCTFEEYHYAFGLDKVKSKLEKSEKILNELK